MKRFSARIFLILILLTIITTSFSHKAYSGDLTNSYIRLSSQKKSTATGGTVCAKTPSSDNETETSVQIIFPTSFTVNTIASNWTVDTSNLPAGGTAWPGIGTATAVSGKTVTFPSGNLSANTLYCFNLAGGSTLTTPNSTGSFSGTIRTRNASNSTIDSIDYGIAIVNNNDISVSAKVAAKPTDFSAATTLSNSGSIFPQSTTINYTITYGSSLTYSSDIVIEAQWSLGTVSGAGTPSVDILDYVVGSASDGYSSTPAVIDTVNRTISWTISPFPKATTGQTVTFRLKTNSSYTNSSLVSFGVSGRVLGPGTQTADSTNTKNYQYNYSAPSTVTSTPAPTNTPIPIPTTIRTPTRIPTPTQILAKPLSISGVSVRTVFFSSATINVLVNNPAGVSVNYGTTPNSLLDKVSDPTFTLSHNLTFSDLIPSTTYYFKVNGIDANGKTAISDIFTFKTAKPSIAPEIDFKTLVLTSNNSVLTTTNTSNASESASQSSSGQTQSKQNVVVLPVSTPYQFTFSLQGHQSVKRIRAILRSKKKVLGLTSDVYAASETEDAGNVEISEVQPGVYVGRLIGQPSPGTYEMYIQIYDFSGNIQEQKIAEIKIVKPFTVFSGLTKQPLEGAKVLLYTYNKTTKIYSAASFDILNIENPTYSKSDGTVNYILSPGLYKVEIGAIGYRNQTVEFTIGSANNDDYPQIYLTYQGFNFFNQIQYYISAFLDTFRATQTYITGLSQSIRFFELNALIVTALFVFLTLVSFTSRIHIPLRSLFEYVRHMGRIQFVQKRLGQKIKGRIYDEKTSQNIANANIFLIDTTKNKIVSHTTSNSNGDFVFTKLPNLSYEIEVLRDGYEPVRFKESEIASVGLGGYLLSIKKREFGITFLEKIKIFTEKFMSLWFETLLILSFVFELSLGFVFGWSKASPFILFSILNLLLWILHISHTRRERNFL